MNARRPISEEPAGVGSPVSMNWSYAQTSPAGSTATLHCRWAEQNV
jgi:hypothetical protein